MVGPGEESWVLPWVGPLRAARDRWDEAQQRLAGDPDLPVEGECLVCFVARALVTHGCDGTVRWVHRYRDAGVPLATSGGARHLGVFAACDCALPQGAYVLAREHLVRDLSTDETAAPDPLPGCHGVRPRSTRPCALWVRNTRSAPT